MRRPFALCLAAALPAAAATLEVGPGKPYATPCLAIAAAQGHDLILVDAAGNYAGDTCAWATDGLTIRGINGRPHLDATGTAVTQKKGIFVITAPSATVENLEFSGAAISVADGNNGAGIRHQGTQLTVRDSYFHDNQNGLLGSPPVDGLGSVTLERCEFSHNGAGDGFSHNVYLGHYGTVTLRASYSHGAKVGHLFKSRAWANYLLFNRLTDETGTTASYEVDLPNGGTAVLLGNVIEQSAASQNPTLVAFGEEGATNPANDLTVVHNTFVNDLGSGTFVRDDATSPARLENNLFAGGGTLCTQSAATLAHNWSGAIADAQFLDAGSFDYHLGAGAPGLDLAVDAGVASTVVLMPDEQYLHPVSVEPRRQYGPALDLGAFEAPLGEPFDAGVDAGVEDAGVDAGTPDAGLPQFDAGAPDAGTEAPPAKTGCGCNGAPMGPLTLTWLTLLWRHHVSRRSLRGAALDGRATPGRARP
jgi:hypothetical protein